MRTKICPLCHSQETEDAFSFDGRTFHQCAGCDLLFVAPDFFLSLDQERQRYDLHHNNENDRGYIAHLSRLRDAILPKLPRNSRGLDFGCGPAPVLSRLFEQQGFEMKNYDRVYASDLPSPQVPFDFVTACEVVEHFQSPEQDFARINSLVRPAGWIALMTNFREGNRRTSSWWYLKDPTHVSFYSVRTLREIGARLHWTLVSAENDIALFQRAAA